MITLSVTSFNGQPGATALSASFDELGGTIGRADSNQFVLPDPDRAISRVHAQIAFRNGNFVVIDRGSNPILVNGQPVTSGREQPVAHGDELQIGGYVMAVKRIDATSMAGASGAPFDPFADLLGPATGAPGAALGGSGSARSNSLPDPLSMMGGRSPPAPAPASAASSGSPSAGFAQGIPEDWDPFAPDPVAPKAGGLGFADSLGRPNTNTNGNTSGNKNGNTTGSFGLDPGAAAPSALIPDLSGGASSLDDLFGLKSGAGSGGDPFSNSALGAPMAQPNMAASHDPMAALNSAPRASAPSRSDAFSDLNLAFTAPPALSSRPLPPALAPAPVDRAPAVPARAVLSWDPAGAGADTDGDGDGDTHGDGATLIRPATAPRIAAVPMPPAAPVAPPPPATSAPAPRSASSAPAPAYAHATSADSAALLAALREGLALPSLQIDALTPELMTLIGQLLHEAARGTVDLLVARAALKREVHAESTMIVARENNPLKFSPSVEAALQHLLAPPTRGFMPAAAAMRGAYDDLRAHQFGFIAGMRAALDGVLQRFDPSELEGRLAQRSILQSLLPGSRKARMWEVFTEHYAQVRADASDDFHTLFGKAFLLAYEAHLDHLQSATP